MRRAAIAGVVVLVAVALAAPAAAQAQARSLPPLVPGPPDALTQALATGRLTQAEYALARARSLFQLGRARREFGDVARPGGRDATLVLRDLAVRIGDLTGADRAAAEAILARPTDGDVPVGRSYEAPSRFACGPRICVHWVERSVDAPDMSDTVPPNDIPAWADTVRSTWEEVWAREIDLLSYRAPLADGASNQDDGPAGADEDKLDVYIVDLGRDGLFGYCAPLDGGPTTPVYCAVDNDYRRGQFGTSETPEAFLAVTSAHEFHHASQAAYDFWEDLWILEGTATNIEETVFPEVDDNVTFLSYSPLTRPWSALDRGGWGDSEYGSWIFWRFLEEKVAGGDPAILREIWERVDARDPDPGTAGDEPPDDYSLRAVRRELGQRGRAFADAFARFGLVNRSGSYADADEADYPVPPLTRVFRIGGRAGWKAERRTRLQHLATRFFAFVPRRTAPRRGDLRLRLTVPRRGGRASIVIVRKDGTRSSRVFRKEGTLGRRVEFGRETVKRVELALSNGSTRTRCWTDAVPPSYACFGTPRDDRRLFRFRVRIAS